MWYDKFFLVKVYKQSKALFAIFCSFICLVFYFNYKGIETTPFFIWAMYAGKISPKKEYKIVTVTFNENKVFNLPHTFQEPKSMMIYFTINHYRKIENNNMTDPLQNILTATLLPHYPFLVAVEDGLVSKPEDNARYLQWLKKYLQSIVGIPVNNITVYERMMHYNINSKLVEDSSKILYTIK